MNIDLLVFGEDWGSHPSSTQHLVRHLQTDHDVLWVNSLGMRRPRFSVQDLQRAWRKSIRMFSPGATQSSALGGTSPCVINPRALSWPGNRFVRRLNQHLLTKHLAPITAASNQAPLLWTSLPTAVDLVGHMNERGCIYYCGDDFSALDGVDHGPVAEMEMELAAKSDLIITVNSQLAAKFPAEKTRILPHGVDTDLFGTPVPRAKDLPNGPVAGFYGALAAWFDQALMIELARRLPHWTFLLIGPAKTDIRKLCAEPNIIWLGPRDHSELPRYSQHWTAGLLPFHNNAQIAACNPLKLREYLAAGSAVVTTDFPALDGYRDQIYTGNNAEQFAAHLEHILHTPLVKQTQQRILRQDKVANESWAHRANELRGWLCELPA